VLKAIHSFGNGSEQHKEEGAAMKKYGLIAISAGAVMLLSVPSAFAACQMPSQYSLTQGNGFGVTLRNVQKNPDKKNGFFASAKSSTGVRGDVSGTLNSKGRLKMTIEWDGGSVGVYTGVVDDDGSVQDGRTYDEAHPGNWATWEGSDSIDCEED
jgi:hypothetical protein